MRLRLATVALCLGGAASAQAQALTPEALARKNSCMACHGLVHKQVGPGFAEVARRYRNDAALAPQLAAKIRNGSVGTWGRLIMPRQPQLSEDDALVLARWVLSQPPPPP
ncbi:cytochrome C [Variovorax sp. PAMC 28711]|nr:cytochrome C [Variovorax sp. PAMC 28711]